MLIQSQPPNSVSAHEPVEVVQGFRYSYPCFVAHSVPTNEVLPTCTAIRTATSNTDRAGSDAELLVVSATKNSKAYVRDRKKRSQMGDAEGVWL